MKLPQQARECTKMKKEADVESGACGQESLRTTNCADVQVLVSRSEKEREHVLTPGLRC